MSHRVCVSVEKKKKTSYFINPSQGNFFLHSVVFTHITHTGRIYMHTHNHMQRRGGRESVNQQKGAV